MTYLEHLKTLLTSELNIWIARSLPFIIRRSLNTGLHRIWLKGDFSELPKSGLILAGNHSSWWDAYLAWFLLQRLPVPGVGAARRETLEKFPFFKRIGAVDVSGVRGLLRRLRGGEAVFIFPEGDMRPPGRVQRVKPGLVFLAERADVPVYPVAVRTVMRGAQKPEAFVVLGEKLKAAGDFQHRMNGLLADLDGYLLELHPEAEPEGFVSLARQNRRFDERIAGLGKLWRS